MPSIRTSGGPRLSRNPAAFARILTVAPALAEAVRRIHNGESVSALFDAARNYW